jgi:hypothetical protein
MMALSVQRILLLTACVLVSFAGVAVVNAGLFLDTITVDWLFWGVACLMGSLVVGASGSVTK